ncbi:hypothetical protein SDC9_129297 [bioreactor metagenome]|uniref:EamA domain-containing protein n=1 Tax=bioreactor metagenome TaxID=1076179 RepID=A0A645CYK4_9ZZZZ
MKEKIYFLISMIIFGAVGVFAKYITMPSAAIALCLSLIGTVFLLVLFKCTNKKVEWSKVKKNIAPLFIASITLSGNWIFLFEAYKETTIANAALSYYFAPVLVILFSPVVLKERLSRKKLVCISVAFLGLFLILQNSNGSTTGNHLLGITYGLIAAGFYAGLTLVNKFIQDLDGLSNTLLQLSFAVVILFQFVLFTNELNYFSLTSDNVLLMLMMGILHGGIGFYLFFVGMNTLKGQSIAILSYVDPLTSLLISVLFVGEKMSLQQLFGTVLLLGAIWIGDAVGEHEIMNDSFS